MFLDNIDSDFLTVHGYVGLENSLDVKDTNIWQLVPPGVSGIDLIFTELY